MEFFCHLLAQALGLGGAGYGHMWSKRDFIGGTSAAGMHRMQKRVAGSGNIFKPAPDG